MLITSPERSPLAPRPDPEALIKEARARQRRRRLRTAAAVVALLGVAAIVWGALGHGAGATTAQSGASGGAAGDRCPGTDLGELAYVRGGALDIVDFQHCRPIMIAARGVTGTPAFSFDGSYVSFGRGYLSARGGPVHPLPSQPVWAPRRNEFAVVTGNGGLELIAPGATARRLLPAGWGASPPAWSPDGRTLAVVRGSEVWVVDVATGHARRMLDAGSGQPIPVGFSPDGNWYVYREYPNSASLAADGMALMVANVRSGKVRAIASSIGRSDFVTWCGNALAYVTNHGGRIVTAGDGIAVASAPAWQPATVLAQGGRTSWNALACAGGRLVVSAGPTSNDSPFGKERRSLYTVAAKAGATPRLLAATRPPAGKTDELPMWSGDKRFIVFVRTSPNGIRAQGSLFALDTVSGRLIGPVAPVGGTGNYYGSYGWANQIAWHR